VYAARAKDIQAQLRTAGDEVKDQEVAIQFLAGLPPAYGMISTLLTSGDRELLIDEMLPKLLQVEQMAQPERPSEAALFAKPNRERLWREPRQHQPQLRRQLQQTAAQRRPHLLLLRQDRPREARLPQEAAGQRAALQQRQQPAQRSAGKPAVQRHRPDSGAQPNHG
jgi:hypothetical protein